MLVLSRRPQETIVIDGTIRLTVLSIGQDRVRLGIEAPAHISVNRQEIEVRIASENTANLREELVGAGI